MNIAYKNKLAVIIPAYNEGRVLQHTIQSLLKVIPEEDIYLVSDGSTDNTIQLAQFYLSNILVIEHSKGKAEATNQLLQKFKLIDRYKYIMPIDADTMITKNFLRNSLTILENDMNEEIVCLVGKVTGRNHNWLTKYRIWEYEIAQAIHKSAQSEINSVIVCPGCSTIYRSSLYKKVSVPTDTLTEDMDLTFLIHRMKLGKIVYSGKSKVVTQDPQSLSDYFKQLERWYTGFWQCLIKHNIPWGGQLLDLEVGLLALEGLYNGVLMISIIFLIPLVIKIKPLIIIIPFLMDFGVFLIPTMIYAGIKNKINNILFYIPHFYLLRMISSIIFLYCFIKVILAQDFGMKWNKLTRYEINI